MVVDEFEGRLEALRNSSRDGLRYGSHRTSSDTHCSVLKMAISPQNAV